MVKADINNNICNDKEYVVPPFSLASTFKAGKPPKVSIANMQYEILGDGKLTVYFKNDTTKKVEISGRGNWGLKPDEKKVEDPIGDVFLNSDDTVKKYNLVIETHKEAGYK